LFRLQIFTPLAVTGQSLNAEAEAVRSSRKDDWLLD
jgi:hypothetical protein